MESPRNHVFLEHKELTPRRPTQHDRINTGETFVTANENLSPTPKSLPLSNHGYFTNEQSFKSASSNVRSPLGIDIFEKTNENVTHESEEQGEDDGAGIGIGHRVSRTSSTDSSNSESSRSSHHEHVDVTVENSKGRFVPTSDGIENMASMGSLNPNTILKKDRVLLRVEVTVNPTLPLSYDDTEAKTFRRLSTVWKEYIAVLCPGRLDFYDSKVVEIFTSICVK